jgi:hypothetical protein
MPWVQNFFEGLSPNFLIGSVSGGPFGRVSEDNSVGAWLTFGGRTQSVIAQTQGDSRSEIRGQVFSNGKTVIADDSLMQEQVLPSDGVLPMRVEWRRFTDNGWLATSFYKAPLNWSLQYVNRSDLRSLAVEEGRSGGWRFLLDSALVAEVNKDGQLRLWDPRFSVQMLPASDRLSLGLFMGAEWVGEIQIQGDWNRDVTLLDPDFSWNEFGRLASGVYIWPAAETGGLWERMLSGHSSEAPAGLALLSDVPLLEESDSQLGLEGESKSMLLLSGGSNLGQDGRGVGVARPGRDQTDTGPAGQPPPGVGVGPVPGPQQERRRGGVGHRATASERW